MTYWHELIEIPRQVNSSDFVLKLTDGLKRAEQTVQAYVVTKGVQDAFGQALGMMEAALAQNSSKAAYLHGSFGSGKSHFMAMLDLLMSEGYSHLVRKKSRLAPVIAKHDDWLTSKKMMMIPYHFLGAATMEEKILGGYVEHIQKHFPEAPIPGVYVSTRILENAESLRDAMGDETFFQKLNGEEGSLSSGPGDWMSSGWDLENYTSARDAAPTEEEHIKLVGALIGNVLTSMIDVTASSADGGGFVSLEAGLSIITKHARDLGYDGLVLFLDELILWLSRRATDLEFIHREEQKLSKLVEAQNADRPIPIISFVARQRMLEEFIGDRYTGAEKASFAHSIDYAEGRFDTINLEDRDLPLIAGERLLRPRTAEAKEQIHASFERYVRGVSPHLRDLMRTREADDKTFRQVYPFSPALVQALVALSNCLQRERTALKLMLMLLVRHRDQLELGQVVPVGDLWDVVSEGRQPFSDGLRRAFQMTLELWNQKIKPLLNREHRFDIDESSSVEPHALEAWRDDARLFQTLMIAALVPEVEALKEMTVAKLTALNLSAVRAPLPSMEEQAVYQKLQRWAADLSELRISDAQGDPRISLQLLTQDPNILIDRVSTQDSTGARRRKIRELLFEYMGLETPKADFARYKLPWRGQDREFKVYYRNVREASNQSLMAMDDQWSIVVDYPFDEQTFSPSDDINQLQSFMDNHPDGTETLVWLPHFFSEAEQSRLGRLICVEYVLDRFEELTRDLAPEARPTMRQSLQSLKDNLRMQLRTALQVVFGLKTGGEMSDRRTTKSHLYSLKVGHKPSLPGGQTFEGALKKLAYDALSATYPDAPKRLPHEVITSHKARKILGYLRQSITSPERRVFVEDKQDRILLKSYAEPVQLGEMGDTHFSHLDHWRDLIGRGVAQHSGPLYVGEVRAVVNPEEKPTGIPKVLVDLIVCTYALIEQMALVDLSGAEHEMSPGKLGSSVQLVARELPDVENWNHAIRMAKDIFGITQAFPLRDASNIQRFSHMVQEHVAPLRRSAKELPSTLLSKGESLGLALDVLKDSPRYKGAQAFHQLISALQVADTALVNALAKHTEEDEHLAEFILLVKRAPLDVASKVKWDLLNSLRKLQTPAAQVILGEVLEVFTSAEHVRRFDALLGLEQRAMALLIEQKTDAPPKTGASVNVMTQRVTEASQINALQRQLHDLFATHGELEVIIKPVGVKE